MKNFLVNLINELQAFQELIGLKKNNYSETIQAIGILIYTTCCLKLVWKPSDKTDIAWNARNIWLSLDQYHANTNTYTYTDN